MAHVRTPPTARTPPRTCRRGLTSPQPFSAGGSQLSGGAARSHSISLAAAPPGAATAPNPWPWPAKPGLSNTTAGGGRPRAAHHRSPGPPRGPSPPSTPFAPPRPCANFAGLPPPLTLGSHPRRSPSPALPRPQILPLSAHQPPSGSSGWLEPTPHPSLSRAGPAVSHPAPEAATASSMPTPPPAHDLGSNLFTLHLFPLPALPLSLLARAQAPSPTWICKVPGSPLPPPHIFPASSCSYYSQAEVISPQDSQTSVPVF